jgi:hypothetical protein
MRDYPASFKPIVGCGSALVAFPTPRWLRKSGRGLLALQDAGARIGSGEVAPACWRGSSAMAPFLSARTAPRLLVDQFNFFGCRVDGPFLAGWNARHQIYPMRKLGKISGHATLLLNESLELAGHHRMDLSNQWLGSFSDPRLGRLAGGRGCGCRRRFLMTAAGQDHQSCQQWKEGSRSHGMIQNRFKPFHWYLYCL